jgi:DNA-binding protein HU-beta
LEFFTMNKSQLIKSVADKSELSQKQVSEAWNLIEATIVESLKAGEKVQLSGFGTFEVRERAERKGRNPKTGEVVSVPACKYLAFVPAKAVKETLN